MGAYSRSASPEAFSWRRDGRLTEIYRSARSRAQSLNPPLVILCKYLPMAVGLLLERSRLEGQGERGRESGGERERKRERERERKRDVWLLEEDRSPRGQRERKASGRTYARIYIARKREERVVTGILTPLIQSIISRRGEHSLLLFYFRMLRWRPLPLLLGGAYACKRKRDRAGGQPLSILLYMHTRSEQIPCHYSVRSFVYSALLHLILSYWLPEPLTLVNKSI